MTSYTLLCFYFPYIAPAEDKWQSSSHSRSRPEFRLWRSPWDH